MVCVYFGTIKGGKLNESESYPSPICQKKKNVPNPARMDSACRACRALVGGCSLLSGVQQSDGLREEAVLRSVGSGPDAAVPSAIMARVAGVSDDLPCFPHDDVLGRLNYSLQGFPVESGAVFVPGRDAA